MTIMGRSADKLHAARDELKAGGANVEAVVGDVTDEATVRQVVTGAPLPSFQSQSLPHRNIAASTSQKARPLSVRRYS